MTFHTSDVPFSKLFQTLKPSAIQDIHKLLEAPGIRSLAGAWPDPAVFQATEIASIIVKLLDTHQGSALQYGSTKGHPELRETLSAMIKQRDNITCSPNQILITNGSAQGLDLACRTFLDPGDVVLVGLPTYFGGTGTIESHGGSNVGIPVDDEGIRVDLMEEKLIQLQNGKNRVKAAYVIPNFQNPTGVTMSLARREKLLALAAQYKFMIFEDDPYGELRFEGAHLPSLMALDRYGCVIHLRSTSKTFAPGMRVAWAAGEETVIGKMELGRQVSDISTNTLAQMVLLEFITSGIFQRGIQQNIDHYRSKRDLMLELIEAHFPAEVQWTKPAGGFFTFITLPESFSSESLLHEALKHNIAFITGPAFYVDGSGQNTFRLSFSQASKEDIQITIPALGGIIKKQLEHST